MSAILVCGACSGEPADSTSPASTPPAPAANAAAPDDASSELVRKIIEKRERFRNAPGRTGILAEENRYSLIAEEVIIRDFFQDRRGGFFLDVGCAWPIRASNTYYLEKHLGWSGIGVDALADYARGWAKMRPRSKFFSYLVTDRSGAAGAFFKSPGLGLSSTSRELASGNRFGRGMETTEIEVPMITLDDLLDREGVEKVDLVSMDIEGHEPEALAGFDIERFQPELLVIEGHSKAVTRYLEQHGYRQIKRYVKFDTINRYFRRSPTPGPR
ncbi:MAG: FkbM family methyltransferase [Deltaproteobacteria bacterium]|nr:FkbM family methyltransferase [Deltaproteobacteria bacterium]MBW2420354.1 FkbM family methyltransferase [Deltaproteobacteria bacterium]